MARNALTRSLMRLFGQREEEKPVPRVMTKPVTAEDLASKIIIPRKRDGSLGDRSKIVPGYEPGPTIRPGEKPGERDRVVPPEVVPGGGMSSSDKPTIPNLRDLLRRIFGGTAIKPQDSSDLIRGDRDQGIRSRFGDIMGGKTTAQEAEREAANRRRAAALHGRATARLTGGIKAATRALGAFAGILAVGSAIWRKWYSQTEQQVEHLQTVNGIIAASAQRLRVGRFQRDVRMGAETAESFRQVNKSKDRLEEAWHPLKREWTKSKNQMGIAVNNAMASLLEGMNSITEAVTGQKTPKKAVPSAPAYVNFLDALAGSVPGAGVGPRQGKKAGGGGPFIPPNPMGGGVVKRKRTGP